MASEKFANGLTRKCGSHLRIVPGIPEENYLVHSDVV